MYCDPTVNMIQIHNITTLMPRAYSEVGCFQWCPFVGVWVCLSTRSLLKRLRFRRKIFTGASSDEIENRYIPMHW